MKRLFPVIHIQDEEQTLRNVELCEKSGVNQVFLIHHRAPYTKLFQIAESVHAKFPRMWVGLNALDLSGVEMFSKAPMWVRGVWVDAAGVEEIDGKINTSLGSCIMAKKAGHLAEYFGGVAFKYQKPVSDLEGVAKEAGRYMDIITTSGEGTGIAADIAKIRRMSSVVGHTRLAVASGITPDNVDTTVNSYS